MRESNHWGFLPSCGKRSVLKVTALLLAIMLMLPAVGVGAQDVDTEANGSIRFLHASPDAPAVDILLDGLLIADGIEFGTVTEYVGVTPGDHNVQVVPAGETADAMVVDDTFNVDSDQAYTVAVSNLLNEVEIRVFQSNIDDLPEGETRIRVVNLSPDVDSIDLYQIAGDRWFSDVSFGSDSEHRDIATGTYDLTIRAHDSNDVLAALSGITVTAENELSVFLLGRLNDQTLHALPLLVSVRTSCGDHLAIGDIATNSCLRIVHALLDGPAVDIYVQDSLVLEGLEPGTASAFLSLPAGDDRAVKVVPTGASPNNAVSDSSVDLTEGRASQVVIGGEIDDIKVINENIDLSPIPADQSRLRVVHLSVDAGDVNIGVNDADSVFSDVGYEDFTDSVIVDSSIYDLVIRPSGEDTVLFRAEGIEFEAGLTYTAIAAGRVDNGTFTVLLFSAPSEVRVGAIAAVADSMVPEVGVEDAEELEAATPSPVMEAEELEVEATPTS